MKQKHSSFGFFRFVWLDRENRLLLGIAVFFQAFAWLIYKWCIPGPDYFSDSFSYVYAAIHDMRTFYRPMGYARFLALLHGFSSSANFVVAAQYLLMCLSALAFFFSFVYLLPFRSGWIKVLCWILVCLQPILLVQANLLSSDSLFTALTIVWMTLLLWILLRPGWWALLAQGLLLCLALRVRYNALYYPVVSCIVFWMAVGAGRIFRAVGILSTLLLMGYSYYAIKGETEEQTGTAIFSGFSGWQMANNALYCAPFIDMAAEQFDDPDMAKLHQYVLSTLDSIAPAERKALYEARIGSAFLWDDHGPLRRYLVNYIQASRQSYLESWYEVASLFDGYGKTLVARHPWIYARHFLWPNACSFVRSDPEYLGGYHHAALAVPGETRKWFGWGDDSTTVNFRATHPGIQSMLIGGYPYGHALLLAVCVLLPLFWWKFPSSPNRVEIRVRWLWYIAFGVNIAFSVMAAPSVLRYETCWFILGAGFLAAFLDGVLVVFNA